jgi:hypothetical protein
MTNDIDVSALRNGSDVLELHLDVEPTTWRRWVCNKIGVFGVGG